MSLFIQIGKTKIPYFVRYSAKSKKKRLVVKSNNIELVVPVGSSEEDNTAFLLSKKKWLYDVFQSLEQKPQKQHVQHYGSGAKIQYHGRWLMIRHIKKDVTDVSISYNTKFEVSVPQSLNETELSIAVKNAFDVFFKNQAKQLSNQLVKKYETLLEVSSKNVVIYEPKHNWASCGKDKIIRINWKLIQAPIVAMKYVVAHEVTRLVHPNHSDMFWRELSKAMPNWQEGKTALEQWETNAKGIF